MRVDPNMVPDMLAAMQQSQVSLNTALQQVSTGKSVSQPSDNPAAAADMVQNTIETADVDQYTQNVSSVLSTVQTADSALSSVVTSLTQAVSLGTEGRQRHQFRGEPAGNRDPGAGNPVQRGVPGKHCRTRGPIYLAEQPAPPPPTPRIHPRRRATPTTAITM